jgi:cytoplasmic iron level regulating protein YaaA (DUF328/UPF0246 family)
MLVVISPAKALDFSPVSLTPTEPAYRTEAARLAKTARNLTLGDLKKLMSISDDLARLNRDRFRGFQDEPSADAVKPAAYAFDGDTYTGLDATTMSEDELRWAQGHLRILSGLYGLLRPLDGIQPYRLEMGSRLKTRRGKNLYDYWGESLSKELVRLAGEAGTDILVNCASQEYFGAVDNKALKLRVITPQFMEVKNGQPRIVSFFAKQARGAMARFIVDNRLTDPEALKDFGAGGYTYDPDLSEGDRLVFLREG